MDIRGIGAKTVDRMRSFAEAEDPFNVYSLTRLLDKTAKVLPELHLPYPTHKAVDVPYEKGQDIEVVWLGVILDRNLRDLFEINRARTGVELNPDEVRDPDLNEWVVMHGTDGTELLTVRVDRWRYPKYKKLVWEMKLGEEPVLIKGVKPGWQNSRTVNTQEIWVIDPE